MRHGSQAEDMATEYVSGGQRVHEEAFSRENRPAGHSLHDCEPGEE